MLTDGTIWGARKKHRRRQLGLVDTSNRVMLQQMLNTRRNRQIKRNKTSEIVG